MRYLYLFIGAPVWHAILGNSLSTKTYVIFPKQCVVYKYLPSSTHYILPIFICTEPPQEEKLCYLHPTNSISLTQSRLIVFLLLSDSKFWWTNRDARSNGERDSLDLMQHEICKHLTIHC